MASRTPARSRSAKRTRKPRRSPAGTKAKSPARRRNGRRAATTRTVSRSTGAAASEISPAVREQFEKLGSRWKNLLPRLARSNGSNGSTDRPARRVRHAPKKRAATRRR
jgi:hypothetical protein